ncbi:MAG TPA: MarR family transcriptional regulator [Methanoregula sp.]|nr:MarR family transcriptional regulator [Methanoregula sp.]
MIRKKVVYFTDKEEEFANLLIKIGTRKNIATVLVFLGKTPEATSRELERGTDLRQPEVSIALKYLVDRGWIRYRERLKERKGRPEKVYELEKSFEQIMDSIKNEKDAKSRQTDLIVQ